MKYAFIQRHRQVWPITVQCRVPGVRISGYHAHRARQMTRRRAMDETIAWLFW